MFYRNLAGYGTAVLAVAAMSLAPQMCFAQAAYPDRTIKLVIGFPAGTSVDVLARLMADKLRADLGQAVVVENLLGAGGNISADRVAKSEPDGYTLLLTGNAAIVVNKSVYEKLPYDPVRDLMPISQIAVTPNVLVVHPDMAVKTTQQLVAFSRSRPNELTYAHAGVGISQHLAGELFKTMAGLDIRPIGYRSATAIYPDLLERRVDMCFCNIVTAMPLVAEGKLRALAVTSLQRWPTAPDLPTVSEAGFPGFDATAWFGLMAPRGTPGTIIDRLHRAAANALMSPGIHKSMTDLGMGMIGNSPAEFAAVIQREIPFWRNLVREIGLTPQQ